MHHENMYQTQRRRHDEINSRRQHYDRGVQQQCLLSTLSLALYLERTADLQRPKIETSIGLP
jgi:hypothetical protein